MYSCSGRRDKESIREEYKKKVAKVEELLYDFDDVPFGKFGTPSHKRFDHLLDKRRTQSNVETMRKAEENLDLF